MLDVECGRRKGLGLSSEVSVEHAAGHCRALALCLFTFLWPLASATWPYRDDLMSPTGMASPAGGPSSPRSRWQADAAANALSKGSPRGVAPNQSRPFTSLSQHGSAGSVGVPGSSGHGSSAAAVAASAAAAEAANKLLASKLAKLHMPGVDGLGPAPSGPIPNQGGWAVWRAVW